MWLVSWIRDLNTNQLTGTIPSELGMLQLQVLYESILVIHQHELFADCTHLDSYLQNNQLLSPFPDFLGLMPGIGMVDLRNNYFVRVPRAISQCQAATIRPNPSSTMRANSCVHFQCGVMQCPLATACVLHVVRCRWVHFSPIISRHSPSLAWCRHSWPTFNHHSTNLGSRGARRIGHIHSGGCRNTNAHCAMASECRWRRDLYANLRSHITFLHGDVGNAVKSQLAVSSSAQQRVWLNLIECRHVGGQ